ncbi:MAG: hypothetical protein QM706_06795 [Nitrospira sp.]
MNSLPEAKVLFDEAMKTVHARWFSRMKNSDRGVGVKKRETGACFEGL